MGIKITNHRLHVNFSIPLPYIYRGGGVALFYRHADGNTDVLLGLRKFNPFKNMWSFPGGATEGKETNIQAALREFKEETGYAIKKTAVKTVGAFTIDVPFFHWTTLLIETGKKIPTSRFQRSELQKLAWISVDDIVYSSNLITAHKLHPFVKSAVKQYLKDAKELRYEKVQ